LDTTEPFREQCFLYPFVKQRQDLFGAAVALSGPFVAVGAPNRDTSTGSIANSDLLDVNSGSAVVFALDFLGVRFDAPAYTVTEGDSTALSISRTAADSVQVFFVKSLDRNSLPQFSDYVAAVFDLAISPPDVPLYKTALDIVGAGTATASSQSYGNSSGSSYWSQGVFDYRGLSDYVPMEDQLQFVRGQYTQTYTLHTNEDNVVEIPDETLTVAIYLPSIYPSLLGDLVVTVTITDNSDGEGPNGSVSGNDDWGTVNATVPLPLYQDARVYSTKLSSDSVSPGDRFGAVIDTDENGFYMAVGDEHVVCTISATSTLQHCGAVYIFKLEVGVWVQVAAITPPVPAAGAAFGAAVQIDGAYGRSSDYTLVVGAPGLARAYIYALTNAVTDTWTLDTVLQPPDDGGLHTGLTADLLYGAVNTLALSDDVLAVAAPGAESLYLHYRTWVSSGSGGSFVWSATPSLILHSADRDEDQLLTHTALHTQGYGAAVALEAAGRTLAVGSPYADYGNLGTSDVDMWDSYPSNGRVRARGRVFVYHRQAPSQTVTLITKRGNSAGTFMFELVHRDVTAVSAQLQWNANTSAFTAGMESLDNVGRVEVAATAWEDVTADVSYRQWSVTFLGELDADPPLLNPQWYIPPGTVGCTVCTPFNRATANATTPYLSVIASGSNSAWQQEAALQSIDRRAGDQFGEIVAIDGESLIVGASLSSAITTTTWDFETGDLSGWSSTGTAFQNQPTLGDNAYYRRVYSAPPQHTGLTGRYYIGSFEDRPGGGTLDYLSPRAGKLAGGAQGDAPMGALTSEPFAILGDSISMLVGGGCDSATVYAELTVDGTSVARAAGRCDELLRRVTFDVTRYNGRMGRIRIVDASSSKWGHISVDDIRFSWTNRGGALAGVTPRDGRVPTVNPTVNPTVISNGASTSSHSCLQEETPQAGAVYVFARLQQQQLVALSGNSSVAAAAVNYCDSGSDRLTCSWTHQTKLVASDKRSGDRFGTAIALNHAAGLIAVGASGSSLTGFWREPATVYTTEDPFGTPFEPHTSAAELPANGRLFEQLRATGAYSSLQQAGSGAPLVWNVTSADATAEARVRGASNAGAVYVYKRAPAEVDCKGVLQRGEAWTQSEHFRLQAHDSGAGDRFGAAIALVPAQRQLLVGAPRAGDNITLHTIRLY
jgi:FG-GAP repeat